jgi:hypothetical protein
MSQGHTYAVQSAALYFALLPFATLFVMMIGARFFDGVRRKRKPAGQRPAIIGLTAVSPARRFLSAVD